MNNYPKLSIITPSFNQDRFLEATIQSVLDQRYPNTEYIIVDGGSSDQTLDIIRRYEKHLAYWVSEPDQGQGDAINKGLERATGDIIGWINSDDCYLKGAFESVVDFFLDNPHIGCAMGDLLFVDADSKSLYTRKTIPFHFKTALWGGASVPQPATFFSRRALQINGGLDIRLNYLLDYEFFLRMYSRGVSFGLIKKPLAGFRLHSESKTVGSDNNTFWQSKQHIIDDYAPKWLAFCCRIPIALQVITWTYRLRSFLVRSVLRGDMRPFKVKTLKQQAK